MGCGPINDRCPGLIATRSDGPLIREGKEPYPNIRSQDFTSRDQSKLFDIV
jgi:hypothetical protein